MLAQNHQKSKKFKFEEVNEVDFSWDISPEGAISTAEPVYGSLLRNVYHYDPSMHEFDRERFYKYETE